MQTERQMAGNWLLGLLQLLLSAPVIWIAFWWGTNVECAGYAATGVTYAGVWTWALPAAMTVLLMAIAMQMCVRGRLKAGRGINACSAVLLFLEAAFFIWASIGIPLFGDVPAMVCISWFWMAFALVATAILALHRAIGKTKNRLRDSDVGG